MARSSKQPKAASQQRTSALQSAPEYYPQSRAEWRQWLSNNHELSSGIWLIYDKKGSTKANLNYDEAVEEALCFGWIDSLPGKVDDKRWKQYFAPRKTRSVWSKLNKSRIDKLLAEDLMMPAGMAKIDLAKANGSWEALDAAEAQQIPEDLLAALAVNPVAEKNFLAFAPSYRKGIIGWISSAKRAETRSKRVAKTVSEAALNRRAQFDK